ncbi:serine/threonine-protein phosphatase 7 long form-like protein [Gossypium australe]|uniref:Serine/threonine-protein phosphatase 7 long form-like protein n=1 Tax=Gossypium australe TaxID=47621 RepID=A0A5B6UE14_9ROSI|nr:serine/threonine-protein phosphatase 7 long form-like protein [Gossypium australe]
MRHQLHDPDYFPDQRVIPYLNIAGFGVAAYIKISELRAGLISALVERWRLETHTFHLSCGEVNITLQDVAVQLGLSINGEAMTGLGRVPDPWGTCKQLLGRVPPNNEEGRLTYIKFTWLKENFQHLLSSLTQMDIIYAARAFILQLIGGILLLDVNQNKVLIMYLPLLENLELAGRFSWGSAVLACFLPNWLVTQA